MALVPPGGLDHLACMPTPRSTTAMQCHSVRAHGAQMAATRSAEGGVPPRPLSRLADKGRVPGVGQFAKLGSCEFRNLGAVHQVRLRQQVQDPVQHTTQVQGWRPITEAAEVWEPLGIDVGV